MNCKSCEYLKLKINFSFGPHKKDQVIKVEARNGQPISQYWRRRLRDAQIDKCVSIVRKTAKSKPQDEVKS